MRFLDWLFGKRTSPEPPAQKRYEYPTGNVELVMRVERGEFLKAVMADINPRWTPGNEHLWDDYDPESLLDTPEKALYLVNALLFCRLTVYRALKAMGRDVRGRDPFSFKDRVPKVMARLRERFPSVFKEGAPAEAKRQRQQLADPKVPAGADPPSSGAKAKPEPPQPPAVVGRGGDLWKNTAVDPHALEPRPKPEPAFDVTPLIQQLMHNDLTVRRRAAETLGLIGPRAKATVPALVVASVDAVKEVRSAAQEALQKVDFAWPVHSQILSAVPALVQKLGNSRSEIRQAASEALYQIGVPAVSGIALVLHEPESEGHLWAARTLGRIGPVAKAAVPALTRALSSEQTHVREAAAEALGNIGPAAKEAIGALAAALGHWHEGLSLAAARALGKIGAEADEALPALISCLTERRETVRDAAAEALVQLGPAAAPGLRQALQGRVEDIRAAKEEALKQIAALAMPVFHRELNTRLGPVRQLIAKLLTQIELPAPWIQTTPGRLGDADASFLRAQAEAEEEIADKVLPILAESLADKDSKRRREAAQALGQLGPPGRRAVPDLQVALEDVSEDVRLAAIEALRQIGGPNPFGFR